MQQTLNPPIVPKKELLPVQKMTSPFRLVIPLEAQNTIDYICSKIHNTEWSGTLFYDITGSFEQNNLTVIVRDVCLRDIGEPAYTEFDENPDVVTYMCEHPDLMDCYRGLIHSHHNMQAFFSGTDDATVRAEGNDMCHFVSLIVNNTRKYEAAITRKFKYEVSRKGFCTYPTFGDADVRKELDSTETNEVLQVFPLKVEIQQAVPVEDKTAELDETISGLWKKKEEKKIARYNFPVGQYGGNGGTPTFPRTFQGRGPQPNYQVPLSGKNRITQGERDWEAALEEDERRAVGVPRVQELPFEDQQVVYENEGSEPMPEELYKTALLDDKLVTSIAAQLLTGSVCLNGEPETVIQSLSTEVIHERLSHRFPDISTFKAWADCFTEHLITFIEDGNALDDKNEIIGDAEWVWALYAYRILEHLEPFKDSEYVAALIETVEYYMI